MSNHIGITQCFFCGKSIVCGPQQRSRRSIQSYLLTGNYIADHPHIIDYGSHLFHDRQITTHDRICRSCLQRADRFVMRKRKVEREEKPTFKSEPFAVDAVLEPLSSQSLELQNDTSIQQDILKQQEKALKNLNIPKAEEMLLLPSMPLIPVAGFTRTPCSSTNCIVAGCCHRNLHRIKLMVRKNILSKQNIYIPRGVRVCGEHFKMKALWRNLAAHCRPTINTFNRAQVADMVQILRSENIT